MLSSRDQGYLQALEGARAEFLRSNGAERCRAAGADWQPTGEGAVVLLPFFGDVCEIRIPEFTFVLQGRSERVSQGNQILILHYLNRVTEVPLTGTCISFKDVPSGEFYYSAFSRRSVYPLLKTFGQSPEMFLRAGESLRGRRIDMDDVGLELSVFPHVPVILILWTADEEFPADLTMLFDEVISQWLDIEDIAVLGQEVMIRMIKAYHTCAK
nr:DUF3786 domain-containing protein [Deltaproteobacteria bacterium]